MIRLRELREARDLSVKDMCRKLGVDDSRYRKWESGKNGLPLEYSLMCCILLAYVFRCQHMSVSAHLHLDASRNTTKHDHLGRGRDADSAQEKPPTAAAVRGHALLVLALALDAEIDGLSVCAVGAEHVHGALLAVRPLRLPLRLHLCAAVGALDFHDHSISLPKVPSCSGLVLMSVSIAPSAPRAYQLPRHCLHVLASIQPSASK